MQEQFNEFDKRNTVAIAVSQEDTDLKSHAKFKLVKDSGAPFKIVADLNREQTPMLDRTTTYLVDKDGVVRQIFPATVHVRPDWKAVLNEMDRLGMK